MRADFRRLLHTHNPSPPRKTWSGNNRHVDSALTGIMFSASHLPNLILTIATLIAGVVFAEVFARYRNIWPLALAQAVGGLLLAVVSPNAMIHHMRVGPGYFFYGIR